mgnify:CR=1 FL=1
MVRKITLTEKGGRPTGATPDTIVHDRPITIGGWSPRNDSGTYAGAGGACSGATKL